MSQQNDSPAFLPSSKDTDRFFAKTKMSDRILPGMDSPCLEWQASGGRMGHGQFWFNGHFRGAHRFAWELERGSIPGGMCVCHKCDNPKCVLPSHMFLGTISDNRYDCVNKGRHARGSRHGSALHPERVARGERNGSRLHPERLPRGDLHWSHLHPELVAKGDRSGRARLHGYDIPEIFRLHRGGLSMAKIAARLSVTEPTIWFVLHRQTWRHINIDATQTEGRAA